MRGSEVDATSQSNSFFPIHLPTTSSSSQNPLRLPLSSPDTSSNTPAAVPTEWLASGRTLRRGSMEPTETLAERRMKAAGKARPAPVRRRSQSLELPRAEEGKDGSASGGTEASVPTWLELASKSRRHLPTSPPLVASTALRSISSSSAGSESESNTPTTASSTLSFQTSAISSSSCTSFTSLASPFSPAYPSSTLTSSPLSAPRRGSAPVSSQWTHSTHISDGSSKERDNTMLRACSEQGVIGTSPWPSTTTPTSGTTANADAPASTPFSSSPYSPSQYAWVPTSPSGLSAVVQQPSPTTETTPASPPSTTPFSRKSGGLYASPRRSTVMEQSASRGPHTPALPSPLSASHTPDELADSSDAEWTSVDRPRTVRTEFPFPASPAKGDFVTKTMQPPTSPPLSLNTPPRSPTSQTIPDRLPPWQPSSPRPVSYSPSTNDKVYSNLPVHRQSDSINPTTSADLAWRDLGLGRVDSLSLFGGLDLSERTSGGAADVKSAGATPTPKLGGLGPKGENNTSHSNNTTPGLLADAAAAGKRVGHEDLMGGTGGGHYGPATRDLLGKVMKDLLEKIPLSLQEEVIQIVEYGALNSRSASLVPPIITRLASRHSSLLKSNNLNLNSLPLSFQVTHADRLTSDFRWLSQQLESHPDSYLNTLWQSTHSPSLENNVFSAFVSRPFGAKVMPRSTISVGFSAMSLHWLSDPRFRNSPANIAHGEMMAFLSARATEFKPGGVLALAFICRSEDDRNSTSSPPRLATRVSEGGRSSSNPTTPADLDTVLARPLLRERSNSSPAIPVGSTKPRDIWSVLTGILGKALQRLVSTQLLKPTVARQLLALPIHARTPRQTLAALRGMQHAWEVEANDTATLSHPAWRGLEHSTVSHASYADHTIQILKIFWESEMRSILREALMSRATVEWILESLFDIAREKVEEEGPQPLDLEVQVIALRRKIDSPGDSTA